MRLTRIYQPDLQNSGERLTLPAQASLHVGQVLRMQPGEKLILFSGDNYEYEAIIEEVHKKKVLISLLSKSCQSRESFQNIHLVQALAKGSRMETVIQKAVELGVSSITPVITAHCAVRIDKEKLLKKRELWQAIAISACEQCGRNKIPPINEPLPLSSWLNTKSSMQHFVLAPGSNQTLRHYYAARDQDCTLIIGPEGGLSQNELALLFQENCYPLSVGPRILRTETAAIAAITLLQGFWGDLAATAPDECKSMEI